MPKLLYVDTNILIYLLERHAHYSEAVARQLDDFTAGGGALVTSTITIAEFLAGTVGSSLETLQAIPRLTFIPINDGLPAQAGIFKREYPLQLGDAIHLVTALETKAEALFTHDKKFANVAAQHLAVQGL